MRQILWWAVLTGVMWGQAPPKGQSTLTINPILTAPSNIVIAGRNGEPLVTIGMDGTLTYGPHYTPDEAAKVFWEAMGKGARCGAESRTKEHAAPPTRGAKLSDDKDWTYHWEADEIDVPAVRDGALNCLGSSGDNMSPHPVPCAVWTCKDSSRALLVSQNGKYAQCHKVKP